MAKKEGTPSLTAERVWRAIRDGSLEVEVVPGTRILRLLHGRIRLTWYEDGEVRHRRIRLTRVYLHPRWIELPLGFPISGILGLGREELAKQGIIRLDHTDFRLLIYQQLGDPFSLLRQIKDHIMPQYAQEEDKLWRLFAQVDLRIALGLADAPEVLQEAIWGRMDQIGTIRTHMAGRAEAVRTRVERVRRLQAHVRGALAMLLDLIPEEVEEAGGYIVGIGESLNRHNQRLALLLEDNPFTRPTRWARYHINAAREDLADHDFGGARHHIQKAIDHLQWPEEKEG